MAFPSNPLVGDTYTIGGKIYRWNGTSWARTAQSVTGQLSSAAIADNSLPISKLQSNALTPYALDTDLTTANVLEVGGFLYFTNTRARYSLTGGYGIEISSNGLITALPVVSGSVTAVNGETGAVTLVTANINEDTNLYYTNARVYANVLLGFPTNTYVETRLLTKANVDDLYTGNISESGGRQYFTQERARASFSSGLGIIIEANGMIISTALGGVTSVNNATGNVTLTTANISEDGNLYFTNTRAVSAITGGSGIIINSNGLIQANVSALGSGTLTSVFGQTQTVSNAQLACATISSGVLNTNNVAEGSNLYFTNTRAIYSLTAGSGISIAANGRVTNSGVTSVAGQTGAISNAQLTSAISQGSISNLTVTGNISVSGNITANGVLTSTITGSSINTNIIVGSFTTTFESTGNVIAPNIVVIGTLYAPNINGYSTNSYLTTRLLTKANVADLTTSNVVEGSNPYYSNSRVQEYLGNISGNLIPFVNEQYSLGSSTRRFKDLFLSGNTIALGETLLKSDPTVGGFTISSTNVEQTGSITFSVSANAALVSEIVTTNVITVDSVTANTWNNLYSSNIIEGSNLFYTNARARAALSSGTGVNYNSDTGAIAISQNVDITANVTFQNLLVTGNLTVTGNTVSLGVTSLSVEDNMIYLNANSDTTNPDLGFAGNYNDGTYHHAGLFRDATDGVWKFFDNYLPEPDASPYIDTGHATFRLANAAVRDITGNLIGNVTGTVSTLDNFTTSNLVEGANLYFTNTRAIYSLTAGSNISIDANGLITAITQGGGTGAVSSVNGAIGAVSLFSSSNTEPTSNIVGSFWYKPNGGNLYVYVNDGQSNVWIELDTPFYAGGAGSGTVTNVFGQTQTVSNAQLACSIITSGVLNSDNVTAGTTNLYFTNTRAVSALTGGSGVSIAANGLITSTFSTGVTSYNGLTGDITLAQIAQSITNTGILTTANVIEQSNLYFTNTRAISSLTAGSGISIAANGLLTSSVSGGVTSVGGSTGAISNAQLACSIISSGVLTTSNLNPFYTIIEKASTISGASGAYTHNLNNGAIFIHSSIAGNFTANFTNVNTTNDQVISVALVLVQGGTAYIANAVQIDNNSQTIKWINGQVPTGSPSNVNIQNFTLIRTGSAWTVLGSMSLYS